MINKKLINLVFVFLFAFAVLVPASAPTLAAPSSTCDQEGDLLGLGCVGSNTGLSDKDPRIIIVQIINVILGLLGIVVTVLIVYAGFLWMTAGGEESKVEKARKIIVAAIIGLAIILSAFAITRFVSFGLYQATMGSEYPVAK
ncbi:MAG: hypothetical protein COX80_03600 [Candidatus Magasanikbacteria bacterium CG_4_10_14_0_2_um_filter_33_14]|uniref:TrbC/VIRB2 family protein n=1 Tax=Candidatus Magasanikbacteria bacterium CG_4_10_14_0_2_um_filter_33_14 TaxID=1974636 RepID=A0A2M7VAB0_9BACT|nr:MAG: hypothetical protein COX80_03600 [Candidatus Magasanikbacteria bacterium CG_4_10_14_0_2_um_filter_33_14]